MIMYHTLVHRRSIAGIWLESVEDVAANGPHEGCVVKRGEWPGSSNQLTLGFCPPHSPGAKVQTDCRNKVRLCLT